MTTKRAVKPVLWANGINLSGLWFDKPRRMVREEDMKSWWDRSGNFEVILPGQHRKGWGLITFASENKAEAEAWTLGVQVVMLKLKEWCS